MSPLIFVSVFFATLCIDALYALYTVRIIQKKALQSATFGSLIHILTAFTVISYTQNYFYLIPLVLGSFIGTFFCNKIYNVVLSPVTIELSTPKSLEVKVFSRVI